MLVSETQLGNGSHAHLCLHHRALKGAIYSLLLWMTFGYRRQGI